ncbi:unnamed protein product, partial [Iphiclides podalirius]
MAYTHDTYCCSRRRRPLPAPLATQAAPHNNNGPLRRRFKCYTPQQILITMRAYVPPYSESRSRIADPRSLRH